MLKGDKMEQKERNQAMKLLNEEQVEQLEIKAKQKVKDQAIATMLGMSDRASKIQERNAKKMKERGLV